MKSTPAVMLLAIPVVIVLLVPLLFGISSYSRNPQQPTPSTASKPVTDHPLSQSPGDQAGTNLYISFVAKASGATEPGSPPTGESNTNYLAQTDGRFSTQTVDVVVDRLAIQPALDLTDDFKDFIGQVTNGDAGLLSGVYVEDVLALRVIQQPNNDPSFVSSELGTATEFRSAAKNGVTGLLAHNYLSGIEFYDLQVGQEVNAVYGDGSIQKYRVESIDQYQKLEPSSLRSQLIDLRSGEEFSTAQVFGRYYRGEHRLTFQTCLERSGLSNWGLTFITAVPVEG